MITPHNHHASPRHRGLTLLELLLAVAGTGFVASAIVMMLSAISTGTSNRTDLRQAVVKQKTVTARLTGAIRSSYLVLAADDDLIVLWTADTNGDGEPNLAEIRRIERHAASKELRAYQAPSDLAEVSNTSYPAESTDFAAVTAALRGSDSFPLELWATDISQWSVSIDTEEIQQATLISSRMVIDLGDFQETAIATAALRNQGTTSFTLAMSTEDEVAVDDDAGGGASKSKSKGKGKGKGKGHDHDDDGHDHDDDGKGKGMGDYDYEDGHDHDDDGKGKGNDDDDDDGHDHDDDGKGKGNDDDDDHDDDGKGKGDDDGKGKGDDNDDDGKGKGKGDNDD